ncbi:OmpA family protein [Roseateles sp.]|uniref:OmpA family protein n=1 Tax=Roseateles sp. TaxID=1971397 RepID=UPI003D1334A6
MSSSQFMAPLKPALNRLLGVLEDRPLDGRMMNTTSILTDFDINSADLTAEHDQQIAEIAEFLLARPEAYIVSIIGRASQTGPEANNRSLAAARAERVSMALQAHGFAPSRIGAVLSNGSRLSLISIEGKEAGMNRSVELMLEWPARMASPAPAATAATSTDWVLDLTLSMTVSTGRLKLPLAGQVQLGELKRLDASGQVLETKSAHLFMGGLDWGTSFKEIEALPIFASFSTGTGLGGEIYMPNPPGAVDASWFDGRCVMIFSVSASVGVGAEGTVLLFPSSGEWPGTFYAQVTTGFQAGASVLTALVGVLTIGD